MSPQPLSAELGSLSPALWPGFMSVAFGHRLKYTPELRGLQLAGHGPSASRSLSWFLRAPLPVRSSSLLLGALGVYREGAQLRRQGDGSAVREDEARAGVATLRALPPTDTDTHTLLSAAADEMYTCVYKGKKAYITYGLHFDGFVHNALCPITSESTVTFYLKTCFLGPSKSLS